MSRPTRILFAAIMCTAMVAMMTRGMSNRGGGGRR
jgi:hypothetical protein